MTDATTVQRYVDSLMRVYEILSESSTRANERGATIGGRFLDDVSAGQREASDLSRRLSGSPEQAAMSQASIMAATLAAQARALSFSQLVTDEAAGAGDESTELMQRLTEATKECSEAAAEVGRAWASTNPLAEMAQRSMAAWGMGNYSAEANSKK